MLRPTGTLKLDDRFYIKRPADESVARLATSNGDTLVIKGARQMGKSSLLVRYVAACKQAGKTVAFLDFQGMSDAQLAEYPAFLQRVLSVLLRRLELPSDNLPSIESGLDVTDLVETRVLDRVDAPVLFAFEEVDRAARPAVAEGLLRHAAVVAQQAVGGRVGDRSISRWSSRPSPTCSSTPQTNRRSMSARSFNWDRSAWPR